MGDTNSILSQSNPQTMSPEWLMGMFPGLFRPTQPAPTPQSLGYGPVGTEHQFPQQMYSQTPQNTAQPSIPLDWTQIHNRLQNATPTSFPGKVMQGVMTDVAGLPAAMESASAGKPYDPMDVTKGLLNLTAPGVASGDLDALHLALGVGAKKANFEMLSKATAMELAGHTPEAIEQATRWNNSGSGWFRGPDGKWRFEISDLGSQLQGIGPPDAEKGQFPLRTMNTTSVSPNNMFMQGGKYDQATLGQILNHPELFQNYPELANMNVRNMPLMDIIGGTKGAYEPTQQRIAMTGAKPQDFLSTLLHETQHAIQHQEQFAPGGNADMLLGEQDRHILDAEASTTKDLKTKLEPLGLEPWQVVSAIHIGDSPQPSIYSSAFTTDKMGIYNKLKDADLLSDARKYMDVLKQANDVRTQAFQKYQNIAGEVEARAVQDRLVKGLLPQTTPFFHSYSVPVENQLLLPPHPLNVQP